MFSYYFNIGLIYFVIGFGVALIFYFLMKKPILGHFWGALVVALVGSFLGGFFGNVFSGVIHTLANLYNSVNIFPPIITAFIVIWIFSKVSEKKE